MTSQSKKKLSILVADDSPDNLTYLKILLTTNGYDLIIANNGRDAYNQAISAVPSLILMDVMMPVMDGLTSIKLLRSNQATKDIPIVVMTALNDAGDSDKCLQAGADNYVPKPINSKKLLLLIADLLKKTA